MDLSKDFFDCILYDLLIAKLPVYIYNILEDAVTFVYSYSKRKQGLKIR